MQKDGLFLAFSCILNPQLSAPPPFPDSRPLCQPKVPGVTFPRHSPFGLRCLVEFGEFEPHRCTGVTWVDRQGRTGSALVFLPPELPGRKKLSLFPSGSDLLPCGPSPICIFHNDSGFSKIRTRGREGIHTVSFDQKKKKKSCARLRCSAHSSANVVVPLAEVDSPARA